MIKITLEERGLSEQIEKLASFNRIAEPYMRGAGQDAVGQIAGAWRVRAPVETEAYVSTIAGRIDFLAGMEVIGIVGTGAGATGFPYPANLETSGRYHYATGARGGRSKTKGQARRALMSRKATILQRFGQAVDQILDALSVR